MDKQATHVVMLSDMEPGTKIPDGATVINDESETLSKRKNEYEMSNTTDWRVKLMFISILLLAVACICNAIAIMR